MDFLQLYHCTIYQPYILPFLIYSILFMKFFIFMISMIIFECAWKSCTIYLIMIIIIKFIIFSDSKQGVRNYLMVSDVFNFLLAMIKRSVSNCNNINRLGAIPGGDRVKKRPFLKKIWYLPQKIESRGQILANFWIESKASQLSLCPVYFYLLFKFLERARLS